jgi:hypothetical protein
MASLSENMAPNKSYFSNGFIKPTKRLYKFLSLRGIRLSEAFFMQKIIERDRCPNRLTFLNSIGVRTKTGGFIIMFLKLLNFRNYIYFKYTFYIILGKYSI